MSIRLHGAHSYMAEEYPCREAGKGIIGSGFLARLKDALWAPSGNLPPGWRATVLRVLRTLAVLFRDTTRGQLTLRAMGLVYTTLLSLVPLLALSFSVLKAFGVHNQIQPILQRFLAPLGESSQEITGRIILFIDNMNVGVLGYLSLEDVAIPPASGRTAE